MTNGQIITALHSCSFSGGERVYALHYLQALKANRRTIIEQFERFGDTPYKQVRNMYWYHAQLEYGYEEIKMDKLGYLVFPAWEAVEIVPFPHKVENPKNARNTVTLAQGKNGKWTWGISYLMGAAGGAEPVSQFSRPLNTREEALMAAIKAILRHHEYERNIASRGRDNMGNYSPGYSEPIVAALNAELRVLEGTDLRQLSLF